jgi:subtilisin family serine protease
LALALADAINRGVDVINLSLTYHARSRVIDLLLQRAQSMGIVVVASAGNDAATTLSFPATDSSVLPVTALNNGGTGLASFANRSPRVPLAAPGENVYGALDEGRFGTWSGTSMAAPFAAAGAALIRSLDPSVSPSVVRQILVQAGVPLVDGAWDGAALDLGAAVSIVAK